MSRGSTVSTVSTAIGELAGYTIGITAARRRQELGAALERRGAQVMYGAAIQIVPLADDTDTLAATMRCIDAAPDIVVVTTGIGFRGWMEAADGWGLLSQLFDRIAASTVVTRGPKARGAVRAAGLTEAWSPESESTSEVLEYLLSHDLTGRRIAVQLHGEPVPDLVQTLSAAGAEIVEVPVYRWVAPKDTGALNRLIEAVAERSVDAAAFTSAPAAASFLIAAEQLGRGRDVIDALRSEVVACCVGPVTASPLERADIPTFQPDRPRLGAMVRSIAQVVPERCGRTLEVARHRLQLRGHAVVLDDELIALTATGMALLQALAHHPGRVVGRAELLGAMSENGQDEHAVEVTVARVRAALKDPRIIQTVVKRGYRLAYESERAQLDAHEAEPTPHPGGTTESYRARELA